MEEFKAALVRSRPVRRAWLVRKALRASPWRRCYVLLLECSRLPDDDLRALLQFWERTWALPGLVVAWPVMDDEGRTEVQRNAGAPVWVRGAR